MKFLADWNPNTKTEFLFSTIRSLITSADHRWSVLRNNRYRLIDAKDLRPGDMALRSTFKDVISRRTFVNGMLVNKDLATVFGYIARSLSQPDSYKMRISVPEDRYNFVMQQLARIGFTEGFNTYYMNVGTFCIGIRDEKFKLFLKEAFGATDRERKIPDFIMSANATIVSAFLDGYTNDPTKVGRDSADDIWILDIPNTAVRDSLAFLFARIETDTLYRDTTVDGEMEIAMKLVPMDPRYGDMILDEIKVIKKGISAPIMVDIDVNDNLYAVANGIVTHNSKYPLQAISVEKREAPLVRGLDEASGKDMQTLIGKYLGARFAPRDGVVTAVRKDRIDVRYDDGSKGSIDMYVNFPMNAKGYINNTPRVKAGQSFKKGDCLASSNYTDDKGVAALGTNLRSAWMSWKGGTYEDAIVISESAAKKLTSTTMYKTAVDLDKTVKLGKQNYITWKPGEFSKEQMENLDANGIVKPGTILHKEDPMILAVRMTEPSPGTLGKRILTDMSERWEHDHPGVVTDVVKTRKGIKVYATVTAPAEVGDKLSGGYGNKGEISQILPDDEMPTTKKGEPIDILLSPLGLISRTNNSQIYEGLLGKVAAKTGKTITVPQFFDRPIPDFVAEQLKQNHIEPDEDLVDPSTGRVMPNITTGISYIYKLKHLAESKMSARGTSTYDCYSADTDVLTNSGWKPWPEVTIDDLFWTCKDGKWFYAPASKIHRYDIDDDMVHISSRYIDSLVTKNHKHLVKTSPYREAPFVKKVADTLLNVGRFTLPQFGNMPSQSPICSIHIPDHTVIINNKPVTYPGYDIDAEGLASLVGWVVSEGHIPAITSDHRNRISISQLIEHDYECRHIEKVLSACGLSFCSTIKQTESNKRPIRQYTFNDPALTAWMRSNCGTHSSNKRIPRTILSYPNTRKAFFESYMLGDGAESSRIRQENGYTWINDRCVATTVSEKLADDLLELAILEGFGASIKKTIRVAKEGQHAFNFPVFTIGFHKKRTCATIDTKDPRYTGKVEIQHYKGFVYCATIPDTGILCVKRNGKVLISGNSEGLPGGKGMDGCFPGPQLVMTSGSYKTINTLAYSSDVNQVGTCTESGEFCYYPSIDSFNKLVSPSDLISIVPKWSFGPKGFLAHTIIPMTPTKNHAIYMYNGMIQKHAGDIESGDKLAGMGRRPSDDQLQVLANLISSTGMVDDDRLTVTYDDDHAALAAFKCGILKGLHVHINEYRHTITVPHYSLYEATLQEQDFGELYKCLQLLDGHGADEDVATVAKHIPWSIIPESRSELKADVKALQEKKPVKEINTKTHLGLMPIVVDKIEPYKTNKELVRVYDLTIDTTHRYILFGGYVVSNSKRFGTLEQSAMAGHNAFDIIKDSKYIRGQSNSDFWRNLRTGDIPTIPGEPLVHKKFFAHLTGAGVNVKKTPQGVSIFALTNKDVNELAGPREVKSRDTYEARTFRPIDDGLFGQNVFGINGDKWGYIQLDEPVPNPVMEEPLARLLNIPEKKFADVASGKEEINGIKGGASMKAALEKIDLGAESAKALNNYKTMTPSGKDKALKRYVAIERMRRAGVKPSDYMLDKIPVIPPIYRPITSYNGLTMVADSNYLYAQLLDARDDARESKNLPQEFQDQARENIYTKWKELTGLYAPQDVKLQSKHVQGLLKWALGDSPKFSALQRKVLSATVDTVGRGVVVPDPRLRVNELGIPEVMAFNIMGPIVERKLVKQGYTPLQAMEKVKKHDIQARDALNEVMRDHPVLMNRAPTLHKLGVMAYKPRLVSGHAIHVNPSTVVPFNMDFDGDTVNIHAPVSDDARKEAYAKMMPERNLIGMRSREILYKPEKEYQQGLYIATRMKSGPDVRTHYFNTLEEAKQAYRDGIIDVDDPIVIKSK